MLNVEALFAQLRKDSDAEAGNQVTEKVASAAEKVAEVATEEKVEENMEKLASELYAGGQLFAEGFVDRMIEKLAGSGVPPAGAGLGGAKSKWKAVSDKIDSLHTHRAVGDNSSVRAEKEAISGAKGVVNPAKPLT